VQCRKVATLEKNTGGAAGYVIGRGIYLAETQFGRGKVMVY
jgi:hypothetical protein